MSRPETVHVNAGELLRHTARLYSRLPSPMLPVDQVWVRLQHEGRGQSSTEG